jgi:PAS domain S-box-containing protein
VPRFPRWAGAVVAVVGIAILWSWSYYDAAASYLIPSLPRMRPNSALAFALAGIALFLAARTPPSRWTIGPARLLGAFVAVLALTSLVEDLSGTALGIDDLLYRVEPGTPARMSPNSALAFLWVGAAIVLIDVRWRHAARTSQLLAFGVLLITLEVFVSYLFGLGLWTGFAAYTRMPFSAMVLFALLGLGALVARPASGLLEPVMKQSAAGSLARRLIAAAVTVPLAAGLLQDMGLRAGMYHHEFGAALLVVGIVLALITLIWFNARQLDRAESQAREARAEHARLASRERAASLRAQLADRRLRDIMRGLEAVVWEADASTLSVSFVSEQASRLLGFAVERWRDEPDFWLRAIHEEDRDRVVEVCRAAATADDECEVEYRAVDADGGTVWLRHSLTAVRQADGRPILLRGIISDVTSRKAAEHRESCQHSVTHVLAEALSLREAGPRILRAICECLDWKVGALWTVDPGAEKLLCVDVWHIPSIAVPGFETMSRRASFAAGIGLPGRVWQSGEPQWIHDVVADSNFLRAPVAAREGLHGAVGFPIKLGSVTLGVMEFFSSELRSPDADTLDMMAAIGNQIGQFIDRKHAQDAVRESEERLRFALEAARTWTWDVNLETADVRWSENVGHILDLAPGASSGDVLGVLQSMHPEDRERVARAYLESLHEGKLFDVEYRLVRGDGTERWAAVRGRALHDDAGRPLRMLGVGTDITERKRIESLLAEETETVDLVNRTGQMLSAELDLSKLVQGVTDAATRLTGAKFGALFYRSREAKDGEHSLYALSGASGGAAGLPMPRLTELLGPTFRRDGAIRLDDVENDPRFARNFPYQGLPPGHLRVSSYLAVPVVSRSAEVLGGLFFAHPKPAMFGEREERIAVALAAQAAVAIDNARLYEAERKAREGAESANRAKDEFLAMLGHELRNPIGAISNSIRVLAAGGVSEDRARGLHAIVARQTATLARLVDDLLDVSRLTSGKIVLKREPVNLADVAERCLASLSAAGRMNHHEMRLATEPVWVDGDMTRLEQVLGNLLENALKYTVPGGRIEVMVSAEAERAIVRVRDSGRGIEPEMIPKIFDVFTQAPQSLERAQGGLGIGLTLVKRLVELHGGEVTATSEGPGRGSEFTICLVRRSAPDTPTRPPVVAKPRPRRILVVEDYADAREAVRALLEADGHGVEIATSGDDGVAKALDLTPDVAIVDVGLPGLDGYEVARRIRRAPAGQRVYLIALTGYGQANDRRRAHEAGFDVHLVKPLDPVELSRALFEAETVVERRHSLVPALAALRAGRTAASIR